MVGLSMCGAEAFVSVRFGDILRIVKCYWSGCGFDGSFEGFVVAWCSQTLHPEPIQEAGSRGQMQPMFEFRE